MLMLNQELRRNEIMWYPACGADLRPVYHVAFNNAYINPKWIIMNDVIPELDVSHLEKIEGISVHAIKQGKINGITVQLIKVFLAVDGRNIMKNIIYLPITNRETFNLLGRQKIHPKTALIHRVKDEDELMETHWIEAFRQLQIKYCYTDNLFVLSSGYEKFREFLQQERMRYISRQSYTGIRLSNFKNLRITRSDIDSCFESWIDLFELSP
jgi:hypothetical protein